MPPPPRRAAPRLFAAAASSIDVWNRTESELSNLRVGDADVCGTYGVGGLHLRIVR